MPIELPKDLRKEVITSIQTYFDDEMDDAIGELPAGFLLDFFLEEIGPLIYNKAVAEAQERMQVRVGELDMELHEEPFQYSKKRSR